MKWKDLSLKERKQIYDSVRVNNPDATYFDIKEQFDSIPTYEDGKGKTINKADLPPEYRIGTPEYFERQRKISGAVNTVQPEAYITPAGYIKDAVNFIEDLGKGDYTGAAIDAALNLIPWGVGKTIKKIKKKVGRAIEGTDVYTAESYAEPFTPTITKKKGKKVKTEADYDQEFAEVKRKQIINMKELEGVYPLYPVPSYKNGGIHIKKSKRGTFKAAAKKAGMGVQEYANKVLKKGSKASPAMKKKANFARNAAKWKH